MEVRVRVKDVGTTTDYSLIWTESQMDGSEKEWVEQEVVQMENRLTRNVRETARVPRRDDEK